MKGSTIIYIFCLGVVSAYSLLPEAHYGGFSSFGQGVWQPRHTFGYNAEFLQGKQLSSLGQYPLLGEQLGSFGQSTLYGQQPISFDQYPLSPSFYRGSNFKSGYGYQQRQVPAFQQQQVPAFESRDLFQGSQIDRLGSQIYRRGYQINGLGPSFGRNAIGQSPSNPIIIRRFGSSSSRRTGAPSFGIRRIQRTRPFISDFVSRRTGFNQVRGGSSARRQRPSRTFRRTSSRANRRQMRQQRRAFPLSNPRIQRQRQSQSKPDEIMALFAVDDHTGHGHGRSDDSKRQLVDVVPVAAAVTEQKVIREAIGKANVDVTVNDADHVNIGVDANANVAGIVGNAIDASTLISEPTSVEDTNTNVAVNDADTVNIVVYQNDNSLLDVAKNVAGITNAVVTDIVGEKTGVVVAGMAEATADLIPFNSDIVVKDTVKTDFKLVSEIVPIITQEKIVEAHAVSHLVPQVETVVLQAHPAVLPVDPIVHSAHPVVLPVDPVVHAAHLVVLPVDPVFHAAHPVVHPVDPVVHAAHPVALQVDPVVHAAHPVALPVDPVVHAAHPVALQVDPVIHAAYPVVLPVDPIVHPVLPIDPVLSVEPAVLPFKHDAVLTVEPAVLH